MADLPRITIAGVSGAYTDPDLVLGYESHRQSSNVVHDIIGGGATISLQRARARSGELELLYLDRPAAVEAFNLLNQTTTFFYTENYLTAGNPLDMSFAVGPGGVSIRRDPLTRKRWIVTVDYQELEA